MSHSSQNAEDRLRQLPIWSGEPRFARIDSGRTNQNFRIEDDVGRAFGRVGSDLPHHGITRANEQRCATIASEAGLAPKICYSDDGVMVTDFLSGRSLSANTLREDELLEQTARTLHRLHNLSVDANGVSPRCAIRAAQSYLEQLSDDDLPLPRQDILSKLGEAPPFGQALIHFDLIPENIFQGEDRLYLIDWEYAGLGHPETDLASLLCNLDANPMDEARILAAYGPHDAALLSAQRRAMVAREALWCLTQLRHEGPSGDLIDYTQLCIRRMLKDFS